MIHYATYFDRHYLPRGLTLYRSLDRQSPPFVLWVLCLDDETYAALVRLRLTRVVLIPLGDLERWDRGLLAVKGNRESLEYYLTCTAPLLLYIFEHQARVEAVTYLDADLYFFDSPGGVFDAVGQSSIALVEHRFGADPGRERSFGTYNVGFVLFRRTAAGLSALRWWRERCLEWCFERFEDGKFGDQKYLDDWPTRFGGVTVLDHKGVGVGPWNFFNHDLQVRDGGIRVDGDPLVFYHFSRVRSVTRWLYDTEVAWHAYPTGAIVRRRLYVPYLRELRAVGRRVRGLGPPRAAGLRRFGAAELVAALRRRSLVVVTDRFALPV